MYEQKKRQIYTQNIFCRKQNRLYSFACRYQFYMQASPLIKTEKNYTNMVNPLKELIVTTQQFDLLVD